MVCKKVTKGMDEGSGKPLCILSYIKTRYRGGGESNVSMNPEDCVVRLRVKGR